MRIPRSDPALSASPLGGGSGDDHPLRVLILSADVGEGHLAAARALQEGLLEQGIGDVVHEDGLRRLGWCARHLIRDGYRRQLNCAPDSYNRLYMMWRSRPMLQALGGRMLYRAGRRRLRRRVRALAPDVVVSTHPALTAALGRMRRRGQLRAVLCATITDLTDNPMWCDPGTDVHVVMDPIAIPWVERHAGEGSAVAVRPLISPRFRRPGDIPEGRAVLGLPPEGSVVVVSGGGWGVGALDAGIRAALAARADHVVALAGRNAAVASVLGEAFADEPRVQVLGFTERMPELLRIADALIHGTGGMTSLEAVECGCPVIAFGTHLAHVEEHNRALEELGLCTVVNDETELCEAISEAVRRGRTERALRPDGAEERADAAAVVMAAVARVRPLPRWLLGLRRSAAPLACSAGLLWTITTADAFSLTSRWLHPPQLRALPAWTDQLDLIVAAPAGQEAADARMLARRGFHVTFSVTHLPSPAVIAAVRAAGDDLIPALESPGAMRWLGTRDDLGDLRQALGARRFLAPKGGMNFGQYLLARSAGDQPVVPTQLPSAAQRVQLVRGEIAVIGEKGPVSAGELLSILTRARHAGLRVAPLPGTMSSTRNGGAGL
jgi:processive 1,2-diacylglycerol beta-glucosyltransferase